jgi:hypothetical protein
MLGISETLPNLVPTKATRPIIQQTRDIRKNSLRSKLPTHHQRFYQRKRAGVHECSVQQITE